MAYEDTSVAVTKSQEGIRNLVMRHSGFGFAAVSERDPMGKAPSREGFHAKVLIDGKPYAVRVMAQLKMAPTRMTDVQQQKFREQEERRIWRVLYYHMKSVFEASDSGVMEFRELMLPYILLATGSTIAEKVLPELDRAIQTSPVRMLEG
jgi:hypothetical protein